MYCPRCGRPSAPESAFCSGCGAPLEAPPIAGPEPPPRLAAPVAKKSSSIAVVVLLIGVGIIGAIIVIGIVAAIAIPGLLRARMSGNEASAMGSLRAISSGESTYAAACAAGGFAVSLEDLAKPPKTGGEGFVPPYLGANGIEKNGYRISVAKSLADGVTDTAPAEATCNASAAAPSSSYFASAEPVTPGTTGRRYFATDAGGVVYQSNSPIANPIRPSASVVPVQ